ncbi:MAG: fimbrillin family protein [Bacteroidaceae bacterium]|nr:fimbrillin family protein [Bacteroidaceae bacterium]
MKKNTFILMAMAAMFGLTSCDKELLSVENTDKPFILFATTESGTKTELSWNAGNENYDVVWSEGDEFSVFKSVTITNPNTLILEPKIANIGNFILTDGAGTTSGTFEGSSTGVGLMAYYPATDVENFADIMSTWPATTQTYTAGKITNSPMIASFSIAANSFKSKRPAPTTVTFTNLGGILRLTVKNEEENVSIKKITVCADQLESPITLDCSNGGSGVALTAEGVEFNIAMPSNGNEPASYSNVSIYLTDTNGKVCCKSPKAPTLDIARSQITNASFSVNSKDFYSYTTGSKVKISGHEGVIVDLGDTLGKVIVATMNVGATAVNGTGCGGSSLSFADACDSITDGTWSGWRLPDVDELTTLCDVDYPTWGDTEAGEPGGSKSLLAWYIDDVDGIDLYLPLNDYDDDYDGQNPYDKYWTGTAGSDGTYYYFAPELDYESGDGEFKYVPFSYDIRNGIYAPLYKEEAAKTSEFLVRLFHDLP